MAKRYVQQGQVQHVLEHINTLRSVKAVQEQELANWSYDLDRLKLETKVHKKRLSRLKREIHDCEQVKLSLLQCAKGLDRRVSLANEQLNKTEANIAALVSFQATKKS